MTRSTLPEPVLVTLKLATALPLPNSAVPPTDDEPFNVNASVEPEVVADAHMAADAATTEPLADDTPLTEAVAVAEDTPVDDQIKVIDSLRISLPLYNVYLNEADEWSRRLVTELAEWALELHQPLRKQL